MSYATGTAVPVERSRNELERLLTRFGADQYVYGMDTATGWTIGFRMRNRHIKLTLPMPQRREVQYTPSGRWRSENSIEDALQQEIRRRWRALVLIVKAKLEAIETGLVSFDEEFLSHTMTPDGSTVAEWLIPQIEEAYQTGRMPSLLPGAEHKALRAGRE